jgi:hypothetical protein
VFPQDVYESSPLSSLGFVKPPTFKALAIARFRKKIPLTVSREDLVAWHFNRNGLFSVRSAYHLQWSSKFGGNILQQHASGVGDVDVWGKQWQLQVPRKIKIFGWRVLLGAIPCKGILANHHIGNSSNCPACQAGCEDIKNLLFTCNGAKEIWQRLSIWNMIETVLGTDRSGSVLVADLINTSKPVAKLNHVGLAELILTAGWYIWWQQRKFVHGESIQQPMQSALSIATLTTNYKSAMKKFVKKREGWKKPPDGKLLINVDASFREESGNGGTGVIIRDSNG